MTFLIDRRYVDFSCSCRIFGKGDPCLEFSMAVSAGSGTRRPQPAATSKKLLLVTWKRNTMYVRSQSRYLCARTSLLQAINPIRTVPCTSALSMNSNNTYSYHDVYLQYQALHIDTSRGTAQYCTVYIDIVCNVSCVQYRKEQKHQGTMSVWRTLVDNSLPDLFMARGVRSATGASPLPRPPPFYLLRPTCSGSDAIFASSSTHAPRAACSSVPYNSGGNFMLRMLSSRSSTTR